MRDTLVAIHADMPVYQAGLEAVLTGAGYRVEVVDDARAWARGRHSLNRSAILVVVVTPGEGFEYLKSATKHDGLVVLALLQRFTAAAHFQAIEVGAACAVPWHAPQALLLLALDAASSGHALIPSSFVRSLSNSAASWLPSREQGIALDMLASGSTVSDVAEALQCSEREMFRRLRALYQLLGVAGRHEAVLRADELGLLTRSAATTA